MDPNIPPKPDPSGLSEEDRMWGMLAHLSALIAGLVALPFVGPLVVYLMYKDKSEFVGDQAKEALNFQIAVMIAVLVCFVTVVGIILLPVVGIGALIYEIIGGMEANKGVRYRYPYTIRLIS